MAEFHHSGQVYSKYIILLERCEADLNNHIKDFLGNDKKDIVDRLIQRISEITRNDYIAICRDRIRNGLDIFPPDDQDVYLNGIHVQLSTGKIKLGYKSLFINTIEFFYFFSQLFLVNLTGVFRRTRNRPATLFFGLGLQSIIFEGSDERFVRFCKEGPITPLKNATRLLIQEASYKGVLTNGDVYFTRFPVAKLLYDSGISFFARMVLAKEQIKILFIYGYIILSKPLLLLLARDIAFDATIKLLDKYSKIESVVITNSSFYFQPLWMRTEYKKKRNYKVHNIHYSQNEKPIVYKQDKLEVEFPASNKIKVDENWVWTHGRKEELKKRGHEGKTHVVGPILWYFPEKVINEKRDEIRIAVFDIMPINPRHRASIGVLKNQWVTENMLKFIDDIVSIVNELNKKTNKPIKLLIKQKRPPVNIHDQRYLIHLQNLIDKNENIERAPYDVNLFTFINECSFSILTPYTSVAYVAEHLNKPSIYYDATDELFPTYEKAENIRFAAGRKQLIEKVSELIKEEL